VNKNFQIHVVLLLVLSIATVACQPQYPPIEELLIDISVFPEGWIEDVEGPGPDPSAPWGGIRSVERTTLFFHSPTAGAQENIERYKSNSMARDEFARRLRIVFQDHPDYGPYRAPDELSYTSLIAEQYFFACVYADNYPFPFYGCQYLTQYGPYVVYFHAGWNLDEMDPQEFENILKAIDKKMAQYAN